MKGRSQLNLPLLYSTPETRKPRYESYKSPSSHAMDSNLFINTYGTALPKGSFSGIQRVESFFKKTHNNFQIKYVDSEYALQAKDLSSAVNIACHFPDSYYFQRANELNLTPWEKQLLARDINELKLINTPEFQASLKNNSKYVQQFTSFFDAKDYIMKKSTNHNEAMIHLSVLIQKIRCLQDCTRFSIEMTTNLEEKKKECPDEYPRAERLVHNLYFKIFVHDETSIFRKSLLSFYFFHLKNSAPSLLSLENNLSVFRIVYEISKMRDTLPPECIVLPSTHDVRIWTGVIFGAKDTPLEGAIYYLIVNIPLGYPFKAPVLRFVNKVFNPAVSSDGTKIGIELLSHYFSPTISVSTILERISYVLHESVDYYEVCNEEAMELLQNKESEFNPIVKEYVEKYA